jgi:dihydrofolate reductase
MRARVSVLRPLPGRKNYILTRSAELKESPPDGAKVFSDLESALCDAYADELAAKIFIIGGASIYDAGPTFRIRTRGEGAVW